MIARRLKELRLQKKLTLEEVAAQLNTSKQNICRYENNIIKNIPLEKIEKLAVIYEVNPAYIMGWD